MTEEAAPDTVRPQNDENPAASEVPEVPRGGAGQHTGGGEEKIPEISERCKDFFEELRFEADQDSAPRVRGQSGPPDFERLRLRAMVRVVLTALEEDRRLAVAVDRVIARLGE